MNTYPRVTHVISGMARASGGPSLSVKGLCQAIARAGCSVDLCTVDQSAALGPDVDVDANLVRKMTVPGRGQVDRYVCPPGFRTLLEESVRQSDIVHTHGIWMPTVSCAARLSRKHQKPLVMSIRGMLDPPSIRHNLWRKRFALLFRTRRAVDSASCYHAAAALEENHLRDFGLRGPIAVIPNGITVWPYLKRDRQASRQWLGHAVPGLKNKRVLLFLSRVHPQKGTMFLIDAWAQLVRKFPDWHLVIAGPDTNGHKAQLEAFARDRDCARSITFLGELYGGRKATIYSASDLFVLPSISESFGRVVIEALASGVPVITTTGTPWQEVVEHKCGWCVDAAAGPLTDAMRDAMSMTDEQRAQAGLRGRDLVVARYDWSMIAAQMISTYNWLRSGGTPPDCVHLDQSPRGLRRQAGLAHRADAAVGHERAPAAAVGLASKRAADKVPAAGAVAKAPAVTHVISGIARSSGGPSTLVVGMCQSLGRVGCTVHLCTIDRSARLGPGVDVDRSLVQFHAVSGGGRRHRYLCPSGFKEVLGQSIGQSDVVHAHGLWDPTLPPAAGLARRLGKPLVISINGVLDPPSFNRSLWKKRVAMLAVFEKVLSGAACYHASSPMEEDHLRKFGLRGPIVVMPIGVDLDAYLKYDRATSRQWLVGNMPGLKDRRVLLFLSRIHPQKGTVAMIDAWASLQREFPDWRLVVAGPDCDGHRAQLQDQAKQLACAHSVAFMDAVSGDDKSMLYAASDLFVLPSISEGFGTVVVEALASGVPVIATTGAPWQELPQHRCGWHVAPASGPLGEAMREAMSLPDEARIQAGLRGRELVMAKYCWPAIAAQMVSMYNWLRFGGSPPPQVHLE